MQKAFLGLLETGVNQMQWIDNNLIDDKNKFLVGYDAGGECCDWAEINVYDHNNNDITYEDLTDWEFSEFPELDADREACEDSIAIVNRKLNVTGRVNLVCSNNGYYSASYWTEKMG